MPKLFGKEVPPIALIGMTVVAVWLVAGALQSPDTTPLTKRQGPQQKKDLVATDYNKGDYTATFASLPLKDTPPDVFRPLVGSKMDQVDGKNQSIDNFSYSGMATIGTTGEGLLENSQTGEGDFVESGQHWHQNWLVVSLSADSISLRNLDTGEDTVLKAGANEKATGAAAGPRLAPGGNAPFNPAMAGPIGGDLTIQSDQSGDTTINMGNGNGRRRGGGRGRGGRGGGGGNGGGPQGG